MLFNQLGCSKNHERHHQAQLLGYLKFKKSKCFDIEQKFIAIQNNVLKNRGEIIPSIIKIIVMPFIKVKLVEYLKKKMINVYTNSGDADDGIFFFISEKLT